MKHVMRITILIWFLAVLGTANYTYADDASLATSDKTIATHYQAYKSGNIELLQRAHKTVVSTWISQDELREVSRTFKSYRILKRRTVQKDRFAEKGDVWILVEEQYEGQKKSSQMNFNLRKFGSDWLIIDFNAVEDEPIDEKAVEKTIKKMERQFKERPGK